MIVVTHYQRLLNYIVPDYVHVLSQGRIVESGDRELALAPGRAGLLVGHRQGCQRIAMSTAIDHYLSQFEALSPQLPGAKLEWVKRTRRDALERFASLGFPSTRLEDWKYTRVTPIEKRSFRPCWETSDDLGVDRLSTAMEWPGLATSPASVRERSYSPHRCRQARAAPEGRHGHQPGARAIDRAARAQLEAHLARYAEPTRRRPSRR